MIKWEKNIKQYSSGEDGFLGKYKIFSIWWDGGNPPEGKHYALSCFLPGIKDHLGHFKNEVEAKLKADYVLQVWLDNTKLTKKEGL